jgi:hypothetical protein
LRERSTVQISRSVASRQSARVCLTCHAHTHCIIVVICGTQHPKLETPDGPFFHTEQSRSIGDIRRANSFLTLTDACVSRTAGQGRSFSMVMQGQRSKSGTLAKACRRVVTRSPRFGVVLLLLSISGHQTSSNFVPWRLYTSPQKTRTRWSLQHGNHCWRSSPPDVEWIRDLQTFCGTIPRSSSEEQAGLHTPQSVCMRMLS